PILIQSFYPSSSVLFLAAVYFRSHQKIIFTRSFNCTMKYQEPRYKSTIHVHHTIKTVSLRVRERI
ncbi:MAG: hypothetical protein ACK583_13695, partial [Cyanobacteriota bacterium]